LRERIERSLEGAPRPAPEAPARLRQAVGPVVVHCHFKGVTAARGERVRTDRLLVTLVAMGDTGGHAAPARVLVVDDEPSIRLLCRINLELDGHEVLEAESLTTVRTMLAAEHIDVVVLDVHQRGERSDPLVAECHARTPPIPVLLVTGSVDVTHPGLAEADAILPKPFELDALLSTVRTLAGAHAHR
jgi:CheY-like chemotaxis protein